MEATEAAAEAMKAEGSKTHKTSSGAKEKTVNTIANTTAHHRDDNHTIHVGDGAQSGDIKNQNL